ncbi:hypothetical protein GGX14DRAFT_555999 [Mycena pura]|uniref:Uncharacterized protein n=1 Tax=Mycena pura TaxID=153505 RepID=A0AAD6YRZ5_9AGAR|nr:hypothetical protein GGX14DRAFT_555999 [Mycena pura]
MPIFKQRPGSPLAPAPASPPARQPAGSFFSRRTASPDHATSDYRSAASRPTSDAASERGSFFFRSRPSSSLPTEPEPDAASVTPSHSSSFFGTRSLKSFVRGGVHNDPKVLLAREKVAAASEAEREADRAVLHARARVRDALTEVEKLNEEAKEESMRAKAKHAETTLVSKAARALGRHG